MQELRKQIDSELNKLDVTEQRVAGESKSLEDQLKQLQADNKSYQAEIERLNNQVKQQAEDMRSTDGLRKELMTLRDENKVLQDKNQETLN